MWFVSDEDDPDPAGRRGHPTPTLPGPLHVTDEREAALPTVPESRLTAGRGLATVTRAGWLVVPLSR